MLEELFISAMQSNGTKISLMIVLFHLIVKPLVWKIKDGEEMTEV